MLGRRGCALESTVARICREAGGRVRTNMLVWDMDVQAPLAGDSRRLEVVVDGLPVQVAVDTTLVHALHRDGAPRREAADRNGVALQIARRRKEVTNPEFFEPGRRAHLVEVGGRWSEETREFLSALAIVRARSEILLMRKCAEQAWRMRWGGMLACAVARAVASSLLGLTHSHGGDGNVPCST